MGSLNSLGCNFSCEECFIDGKNFRSCSGSQINLQGGNLSNDEKMKNIDLDEFSLNLIKKNLCKKNEFCQIDESTLPNLENTKDFKNNTFSEKNISFENSRDFNFKFENNNNFPIDSKIHSTKIFQSQNDCKNRNPLIEKNIIQQEAGKKYIEDTDKNKVNNINLDLKDNILALPNESSESVYYKLDHNESLNNSFVNSNEKKQKMTLSNTSLKGKLFLNLKNLHQHKNNLLLKNEYNIKNINSNSKFKSCSTSLNFISNQNNNYLESDRSNRSNNLMISIGEFKDGLENISNIRVGKNFTNLIKEFNSIVKIYFSKLEINRKFDINLVSEEKENLSIRSNKISDYYSYYSASNTSNKNFSKFNSIKKNDFTEKNLHSRESSEESNFIKIWKNDFNVSKFNDEHCYDKKRVKKIFTFFKNLIYIPIISISGEIKNYFTLKKNSYKDSENIYMNQIAIKTPYFDNLYTFFKNFLENCKVEEPPMNENLLNFSYDASENYSNIHKNKINFCEDFSYNNNFKLDLDHKKPFELENMHRENIDTLSVLIKNIYYKEIEKREIQESNRICEKLEFYFKTMKQFSMLESKIILNPDKNCVYVSFLNLIKMPDIFNLIQKLNFPHQEKLFAIIKNHNLYFEELQLNLKKDVVKIIISQFQKNTKLNSIQTHIAYLIQLISQISEILINKQLEISKIKKLIYEKEHKIFSNTNSQNFQIFIKFNIEKNRISQAGILKEKNINIHDYTLIVNQFDYKQKQCIESLKERPEINGKNRKNHNEKYKFKREYFIFNFFKTNEEYFNECLDKIDDSEKNSNNNQEFENLLLLRDEIIILSEYEIE